MNTLSINEMTNTQAGSEMRDFLDGAACGYGLATIGTIVGGIFAAYGCARVLGWI